LYFVAFSVPKIGCLLLVLGIILRLIWPAST